MREINESWRVLQDPARRRAYDDRWLADRRPPTPAARPRSAAPVPVPDDDDLVDVLPPMTALTAGLFRHLPWVVLVVVFGLIFVMTAYAGGGDDPSAPASETQTEAGSCIDLRGGTVTTIVSCDGPHDFQIIASVAKPTECPPGSEARRFAPDGHFDCLVAP